jgi:hypothetical protein
MERIILSSRQLLALEILTALSFISLFACIVTTYYKPYLLDKGLWVLLLFGWCCSVYVGIKLEKAMKGKNACMYRAQARIMLRRVGLVVRGIEKAQVQGLAG